MRHALFIALASLAACAAPTATRAPAPAPISLAPPPPQPRGLERVLGQTPQAVVAMLGAPTLDREEGPARQLQYARGPCVLDLFFYPDAAGTALAARFADARFKDGRALDPASCLQSQLLAQPLG